MSASLFDELARSLAEPMPRRRALRLVGSAVAVAALGGARPALGALARPDQAGFVTCGEIQPPGAPKPFAFICEPGSTCCQGTSREGQRAWTKGRYCCLPGFRCAPERGGTCIKCPTGRKACRSRCCPRGSRCVQGRCSKCRIGEESCRGKCCPKNTFCCAPKGVRLCCPKNTACCPVGKPDTAKYTCCGKGESCSRMVLPNQGGITPDSPRVCCPNERTVTALRVTVCCPPGHVALQDFTLPVGKPLPLGYCCPKAKACGTGANRTCCAQGTDLVPEVEQSCCNGRCVNLRFDTANCGNCGRVCAPGERCQNGVCVPF